MSMQEKKKHRRCNRKAKLRNVLVALLVGAVAAAVSFFMNGTANAQTDGDESSQTAVVTTTASSASAPASDSDASAAASSSDKGSDSVADASGSVDNNAVNADDSDNAEAPATTTAATTPVTYDPSIDTFEAVCGNGVVTLSMTGSGFPDTDIVNVEFTFGTSWVNHPRPVGGAITSNHEFTYSGPGTARVSVSPKGSQFTPVGPVTKEVDCSPSTSTSTSASPTSGSPTSNPSTPPAPILIGFEWKVSDPTCEQPNKLITVRGNEADLAHVTFSEWPMVVIPGQTRSFSATAAEGYVFDNGQNVVSIEVGNDFDVAKKCGPQTSGPSTPGSPTSSPSNPPAPILAVPVFAYVQPTCTDTNFTASVSGTGVVTASVVVAPGQVAQLPVQAESGYVVTNDGQALAYQQVTNRLNPATDCAQPATFVPSKDDCVVVVPVKEWVVDDSQVQVVYAATVAPTSGFLLASGETSDTLAGSPSFWERYGQSIKVGVIAFLIAWGTMVVRSRRSEYSRPGAHI